MTLMLKKLSCAVILSMLTGPAFSSAEVFAVNTKGKIALAQNVHYSESGCGAYLVEAMLISDVVRYVAGSSYNTNIVQVLIEETDYCTGVFRFHVGRTENPTFSFPNSLAPVTLTAEVVVEDLDRPGVTKTVKVDLKLDGGVIARDRTRFMWVSDFGRLIVRSVDAFRTGITITGSMVVDGVDVMLPSPGYVIERGGFTASSKGGSIDVFRLR